MSAKDDMMERRKAIVSILELIGIAISTAQVQKYLEYMGYSWTLNQVAYCLKLLWEEKQIGRQTHGGDDYWQANNPINSYMSGKVVSKSWQSAHSPK